MCRVHPDLVGAPCDEGKLNQRRAVLAGVARGKAAQDPVAGDRPLPLGGYPPFAGGLARLDDGGVDGPLIGLGMALDDPEVVPVEPTFGDGLVEPVVGVRVLGEKDETRRIAVKACDGPRGAGFALS